MKRLMLSILFLFVFTFFAAPSTLAAEPSEIITNPACKTINDSGNDVAGCKDEVDLQHQKGDNQAYLTTLLNAFVYAGGLVSVIFIIIGGVRYITSTGDAKRIEQAKTTILYAVIGLIVVAAARGIIGLVIGSIG